MPYKSDAQRKFFHTETAKKAGITPAMVKEWDESSKGKKLPKRVPRVGTTQKAYYHKRKRSRT